MIIFLIGILLQKKKKRIRENNLKINEVKINEVNR